MTPHFPQPRSFRTNCAGALAAVGLLAAAPAGAGGLLLYEVGTADVGLASAGYTARAQDASTVFTNPAGMTRLEGTQLTLGAQVLYGDLGFSIDQGTSAALGSGSGGNPVGLFPGGGLFVSYSLSPDVKIGLATTGNFGLALKYDSDWVGRYYVQEATLIGMSLLPSVAWRINKEVSVGASLNAMYGKLKQQVAVNNIRGPDGQLLLDTHEWGFGANLGLLYEPSATTRFGVVYNSQIKLDFSAPAEFSGLSPLLEAALGRGGLLNAKLDVPIYVPQGVNASFLHQLDDRWTVLGSVGWQQWSKFGQVELGVDSNNPVTLTKDLDFKDTWHVAAGAQYRLDGPWLLNMGVAYDSGFQDSSNVSPALPANSAWRFGLGVQKEESKTFSWATSAEYVYGGTLDVSKRSDAPVIAGGRGDLIGSYGNVGMYFLAATFNWKF
jgi:long-chain fatty acid transport protein